MTEFWSCSQPIIPEIRALPNEPVQANHTMKLKTLLAILAIAASYPDQYVREVRTGER